MNRDEALSEARKKHVIALRKLNKKYIEREIEWAEHQERAEKLRLRYISRLSKIEAKIGDK
jgi:hypothetical protein